MTARVLHLHLQTPVGGQAALLAFLKSAVPFYESIEGVRVRLLQALDAGDRFIEVVEYETAVAFERDQRRVQRSARMRAFLDTWHSLLVERPKVEIYQDVSEKIR